MDPRELLAALSHEGIDQLYGVPDSLLKPFCDLATATLPSRSHVITVNEGAAVAMAIGHFLATGAPALVYLQNSGLGNAINPLTSLADPAVYSIPMVLMVGWRGRPGTTDEPQHVTQGRVTPAMLDAIEVPHVVVDGQRSAGDVVAEVTASLRHRAGPVALLVQAGAFDVVAPPASRPAGSASALTRERALQIVIGELPPDAVVVATTGHISRELFEARAVDGAGTPRADFLTVGGMGHASSIALAIASARPDRLVVCLDGDGALLMHLGVLATIGSIAPSNLLHVVLNNGVHESVGGQPTVALALDVPALAKACGYGRAAKVVSADELVEAVRAGIEGRRLSLTEVLVGRGVRADLGRPTSTPRENRDELMSSLAP